MSIAFYSFFTDYQGGVYPYISKKTHQLCDIFVGILIMTSPWLLGFKSIAYKPHLFIGLIFTILGLVYIWPLMGIKKPGDLKSFIQNYKIT
jgi:hypothetical protein